MHLECVCVIINIGIALTMLLIMSVCFACFIIITIDYSFVASYQPVLLKRRNVLAADNNNGFV